MPCRDNQVRVSCGLFSNLCFQQRKKRREPKTSRIYPEITYNYGEMLTNPDGIAEVFACPYDNHTTILRMKILINVKKNVETNISKITK